LLNGRGYFAHLELSDEDFPEAWELHRDALRAEWAANNPPGTRCFAEWLLEIVPKFGERPTNEYWTPMHEHYRNNWLTRGILHLDDGMGMQEPEHEFLFRHGIVDQAECEAARAAIEAEDEADV
jgi:hypothetical protein